MTKDSLEKLYRDISYYCEDMEFNSMWDFFETPNGKKNFLHDYASFDDRRDAFLRVVEKLVKDGLIKLVHMHTHEPLVGSVENQIKIFREAFPKNDIAMNNGYWFFYAECPAGAAWQHPPLKNTDQYGSE